MSCSYEINEKTVKEAREIIARKKEIWNRVFPNIEFDEDGRAKVGFLPPYDKSVFYQKIKQNTSKLFEECLEEAYKELRLKPIALEDIEYHQYLTKRIEVETETGFKQERALPSILAKASAIWERKMPMYRPLRNIYKPINKAKENPNDIETLKNILSDMEQGNTYIAYDNLMRVFQPRDMYISINPLDKLFSSGGEGTNSITKFSSCWRNKMTVKKNGNITFTRYGEYSNPKAQVLLGEHPLCGMLIIPNENSVEVAGMTFLGMLQRSHIWLHEDAIFLENIYPDKENRARLDTITTLLNNTVKTIDGNCLLRLENPTGFDAKEWASRYNEATDEGPAPYLDRSEISYTTGKIMLYGRDY